MSRKTLFLKDLLGIRWKVHPDSEHLTETLNWIRRAQDASDGGGIPAGFHMRENRWLEDYPETTGYTIRTFIDAYELNGDEDLLERAIRMADWESDNQLPNGSVISGQIGTSGVKPAVFNTGQVILGWTRAFSLTGSKRYMESIKRAASWLCDIQDQDGAWRRERSRMVRNNPSTYNVRCAWALAEAAGVVSEERYMEAAMRNAEWSIRQQTSSGWFGRNDFTQNDRPLLHTIAYAVRGLLETAVISCRDDCIDRAETTARSLIAAQEPDGRLAGRFTSNWKPATTWSCLTGIAQVAVIWLRLFELGSGREFSDAASKAIEFLKTTQAIRVSDACIRGGVKGSNPVYGDYSPWVLPNWAAKFLADALILREKLNRSCSADREGSEIQPPLIPRDSMESSTSICMVVKNQLWNDSRVKKEASSLFNAGFDVTIISKSEDGQPQEGFWHGIRVIRLKKDSKLRDRLREKMVEISERSKSSLISRLLRVIRRNRFRIALTDLKRGLLWEYRLYRTVMDTGADFIHAHDLDTLWLCARAAKRLGAGLVYDSHEIWLESSRYLTHASRLNRIRFRFTEKKLIHRADSVIVATPLRGKVMRDMYPGISNLVTVENRSKIIKKLPETGFLRKKTGIPDSVPIALYQGIICPERGLEQLLEAAVVMKGSGITVVVIGHDAWQGTLHRHSLEQDLEDTVYFLPPVPSEELPEVTSSADMGLILFRNTCLNNYYSLPNKLFEYMMAGKPVIASNFPEMARLIVENDCGLLVDPESPEQIARAIQDLAEDPAAASRMGARGRQAALERYNWSAQEQKLVSLYRKLSHA